MPRTSMPRHVLFIQGAGAGAYEADRLLADSLQRALGAEYDVQYPAMPDENDPEYTVWKAETEKAVSASKDPVILVGHSVGGSIVVKALAQTKRSIRLAGLFVIAAPYWGGKGWRYEGYEKLQLPRNAAARLEREWPIFFYHSRDDEIVPFEHLALYAAALPRATTHAFDGGGHQFNNDLSAVARDIKNAWSA